ncbi:MAG: hypothetical protein HOI47_09320 [Candidatus Scalindua sp.]|jgi:hypothetical protein|nr:hypothetical protein [Candidatus Scalindua sp.]
MNEWIKEKAIWLAFAFLLFVVTSMSGYIITGLQAAKESVHKLENADKTNTIQWKKISSQQEHHWQDAVSQSYINGNIEGRLKCLESK